MKVTITAEWEDGSREESSFPMQEGLSINSQMFVLYIFKLNYVFGQIYRKLPVEEVPLDSGGNAHPESSVVP